MQSGEQTETHHHNSTETHQNSAEKDVQLSFSAGDVQDFALDHNGDLVITFAQGEGSDTLVIHNFEAMADGTACFRLSDDSEINMQTLYTELCAEIGVCLVEKPDAGDVLDVTLEGDKQYKLKFDIEEGRDVSRDSGDAYEDLTLTFDDGAQIKFQTARDLVENALEQDFNTDPAVSKFLSALDIIHELMERMAALEQEHAQDGDDTPAIIA